MIQYQGLRPFSAISFDLDDTLYDNRPYIRAAVQQQYDFIASNYPKVAQWSFEQWHDLKLACVAREPHLAHDTSAARLTTLKVGLSLAGYDEAIANEGAQRGLAHFLQYRSNFSVADDVLELLTQLSKVVPLVGITNGNVNSDSIGLSTVLSFVVHPGDGIRMKPHRDMFDVACERLSIAPSQLLHVGDSYAADVQGARLAGAQAAWLNPAVAREPTMLGAGLLPNIELSELSELSQLTDLLNRCA